MEKAIKQKLERCKKGALARLHTWSLVETAEELLNPRRGSWKPDKEWAMRFLEKADLVLGDSRGGDVLGRNDPLIAEDFGGDEELWAVREQIRKTKHLISLNEVGKALKEIKEVDALLLNRALDKFVSCFLGLTVPEKGVSQ